MGVIIQQSDMMAVKYSCWRVRTLTLLLADHLLKQDG